MPELPDVQVFKEYLDATALHHEITELDVTDERILGDVSKRGLTRALKGQAFDETRRYGKYLFVRLGDEGRWLHIHFGMTGRLQYYESAGKEPEHARVVASFANGFHLAVDCQRLFGAVGLAEDPLAFAEKKGLGPDALDIQRGEFVDRLKDRRGSVKSALMNQAVIAGIGNIYSDEILFQARVRPDRSVSALDRSTLEKLWHTSREILEAAIEARADVERLPADWLLSHSSEGEQCPACQGRVSSKKIGGRRSYFCPSCQG